MAVQLNNVDLIRSSNNNVLDVDDTITKVGNIASDIQQAKNDLLGGAGAAYDTLQELATELQDNDSAIATLTSNIGAKADKPASPTGTSKALGWDGSSFVVVDLPSGVGLIRTETTTNIDFVLA